MAIRKWGGENQVNTQINNTQTASAVASLQDGGFVVVWTDGDISGDASGSSIKMQRYNATGQKVGVETLVNTTTTDLQREPDVAVLDNGSILVSWKDDSGALGAGDDIRFRRFNADGSAIDVADIALFYPSDQSLPDSVSLSNGGFAIAFQENLGGSNIGVDIFAANGTLQFHVPVAASANFESGASVTQLADGRMVVTWQDSVLNQVRMQVVNSTTGALEGAIIDVATNPTNSIGQADVTALVGGGFVLAWQDFSQPLPDNQSAAIRARVFSGASTPVAGGEFTVNTLPESFQGAVALAALPDGGFVAVYQSQALGGIVSRIMAQVFNANGSKRGGEFVVDTSDAVSDFVPDASVLPDGRIVVTWHNTGTTATDPSGGIVMQIIDPRDGLVNGTTAGETLHGNDVYADEINGFSGADSLFGLAGNDALFGGDGNDLLYGGRGDDTVFGGINDDNLYGDLGDDEQYGEGGNDIIWSGGGSDLMDGGAGTGDAAFYTNELTGGVVNLADQTLNAGSALGDTLFNFERVFGSVRGANDLTGDASANILVGGQVSDIMRGGAGADVLRGGIGVDTMAGGLNNDIFQYLAPNEGGDVLNDFAAGDKFQFVRTAFGNLAGANVAAANFLSVASGNAATNASQRFIFDESTKKLFYDADGNGATAATLIADLSTSYNIFNTDLLLA